MWRQSWLNTGLLVLVLVVDMVSKRVGGEDAERVRARDGEREGRLLGGGELLKVLRPAPPHLQTRLLKQGAPWKSLTSPGHLSTQANCRVPSPTGRGLEWNS